MRGVRPNRKGTNPFSEPWDYDKTNMFVSGLDGVPEGSVFMRKIFRVLSSWKSYHRSGSYPRVYREILKIFPHMAQEISGNWF